MQPRDIVAGRFEIDRLAGTGGMGAVYRAIDRQTGQPVALKVLHGHTGDHADRFAREARLLSELRHPGIVRFVGSGTTERGDGFIVMEWLEGESLSARLKRGTLPPAEVIALGARVADALRVAHERGIVHRDLKPQNLFLEGGSLERLKVLDFGIARILDPGQKLTMTGAMIGTPGYMSPEQARGDKEVDARTDVYAVGCVMFRALTGRRVFEEQEAVSMLIKVATEQAPRSSSIVGAVPPALDNLLARMLALSPAERPRDASALLGELSVAGGWQQGLTAMHAPTNAHTAPQPSGYGGMPAGSYSPGPPPMAQPPMAQPPMGSGGYGPPPAQMGTWRSPSAPGLPPTYVSPGHAQSGPPLGAMPMPPQVGPQQGQSRGPLLLLAGAAGGLLVLVLILGVVIYVLFPKPTSSPTGGPVPAGICPGEKCVPRQISNASRADAIGILPQVREFAREIDPAAELIMILVITQNDDGTIDLNNAKSFLHYHFQPPQKVGRFYVWVTGSQMIMSHVPSQAITMLPLPNPPCTAAGAFRVALPNGRPLKDNPTTMQLIDVGPPVGSMWNITTEGVSAQVDPRTCTIKRF